MSVAPRFTPTAAGELGNVLHTGPFHAALRAAIRARGLPLDRLRSRLVSRGISIGLSSLSDWQHGHSRPERANSMRAVKALEEILELPPGTLVRLLAARRHGDDAGARRQEGLDEHSGPLAELLDSLPGSRACDVDVLSYQTRAVVAADRSSPLVHSRLLVRARRGGVDRFVVRYFGDPGCAIDRVVVRPGANCRLGRVRRHPAAPVLVAELLFDEVLGVGDTWVFDEQVFDDSGVECVELGHGFRHAAEQYLAEVRFHPTTLPVECFAFARAGLDAARRRTRTLTLSRYHSVHLVVHDVSAGVVGIGWEWR